MICCIFFPTLLKFNNVLLVQNTWFMYMWLMYFFISLGFCMLSPHWHRKTKKTTKHLCKCRIVSWYSDWGSNLLPQNTNVLNHRYRNFCVLVQLLKQNTSSNWLYKLLNLWSKILDLSFMCRQNRLTQWRSEVPSASTWYEYPFKALHTF